MADIPETHASLAFERAMWLKLRQNLKASHHQAFGATIILGISLTCTFAALQLKNYKAAVPLALSTAFSVYTLRRQKQLTEGFSLGEQVFGKIMQDNAPRALQAQEPAPHKLDDYRAHLLGWQASMNNRNLARLAVSGGLTSLSMGLWLYPQSAALIPLGAALFFTAKGWELAPRPAKGTNWTLAHYGQEEYRFQQEACRRAFDLSSETGRRQFNAELKLIAHEQKLASATPS
jgi:hypothetical protein